MKEVTKEQFYAAIGPLNVGPSITGRWDNETGYQSDWLMLDGSRRLVGKSQSGDAHGQDKGKRHWLA